MVIKRNASVGIKGRALGQDFDLDISSMHMIGKARLGGKTYCLYSTKNIRLNSRNEAKEMFGCLAVRSWEGEHYQDFRESYSSY